MLPCHSLLLPTGYNRDLHLISTSNFDLYTSPMITGEHSPDQTKFPDFSASSADSNADNILSTEHEMATT